MYGNLTTCHHAGDAGKHSDGFHSADPSQIYVQERSFMEPQVFVIDDEDSVRNSLDALLNAVGYDTQSFATAADFLDALAETDPQRPRCLLLDLELPDMNGLDLLSELNSRNESMPIIVMTGHGDEELESTAMQRNAVAYFQKPFDTSQLLDVLSGVLAQAT